MILSVDESRLIARARRGDREALAELFSAYRNAVLRVAMLILGDREEADDAAQQTWLLALRGLPAFREGSRFGPWLYRIATNVALRRRQERSRRAKQAPFFEDHIIGFQHPANPSPEEALSDYRGLAALAMDALSARERLLVSLHYFSEMDIADIAALIEAPPGTVKSRMHRARQKLRKEIEAMAGKRDQVGHVPDDFRKVIHGVEGEIPWQTLSTRDFSNWSLLVPQGFAPIAAGSAPENWQNVGGGFVGQHPEEGTCLVAGGDDWRHYELSLLMTPLWGGNAQALFRMSTKPERWYLFDMMLGWQAVAVSKFENDGGGEGLTLLSVIDYPVELEREYPVTIAARGQSITTYIDGALVNQVTDPSFPSGGIGLNVWQSKTLYRDVRYRLLVHRAEG